jgi:hypothetical protein
MLFVVLFWDSNRIAALVAMTLVYLLIGLFALWRVSEHKKAIARVRGNARGARAGSGVSREPVQGGRVSAAGERSASQGPQGASPRD